MARFIGSVAVVTGASSGIGEAICKEFVKRSFTVVGLARREEKLRALKDLLTAKKEIYPGIYYFIKCDLTKEDEIRKAFAQIKDRVGSIQVLVNNAGVLFTTSLSAVNGEHYDKVFDTNVKALLLCSKEAIQSMNDKDDNCVSGHVVNINSVAGLSMSDFSVHHGGTVYMASKHAAKAFTDALRRELFLAKKQIKITVCCAHFSPELYTSMLTRMGERIVVRFQNLYPGVVETDMTAELMRVRKLDEYEYLSVEDVAAAVIYVLETPPRVLISDMTIKGIFEVY